MVEKKVILCSILAMAIGIASVVPLAFLLTPAKAETTNGPWFNPTVDYAYLKGTVSNATGSSPLISYIEQYSIALNFSVNPDAVSNKVDTRLEYYEMYIYSNLGSIMNSTCYFGVSFGNTNPSPFTFENNYFNLTTLDGGGLILLNFNGTLSPLFNTNSQGGCESSSIFANQSLPQSFLNLQNASKLYVGVSRLGYVTFEGNSTTVTAANTGIVQLVELTKNGVSFSYGQVPTQAKQ